MLTVTEFSERLLILIQQENWDEVQLFLSEHADYNVFLQAAIQYPALEDFFSHPDFEQGWEDFIRSGLFHINKPGEPTCAMQLQPPIEPFSLLMGRMLYREAQKMFASSADQATTLLYRAIEHGNFHAMQRALDNFLDAIKRKSSQNLLGFIYQLCDRLKALHGTPGFITVGFAYLSLMKIFSARGGTDQAQTALFLALQHFYTAHNVSRHSAAAIHNVYYGKGLAGIREDNEAGIGTVDEVEALCDQYGLLSNCNIQQARAAAEQLSLNYLRQIRLLGEPVRATVH